jgi:maltose O-acetyltransferase
VTEREKMLAGELYLATDPELVALRNRARVLFRRFNASEPGAERDAILREMLGRAGRSVVVEPPFYCDYGSQIELGDEVFINMNCVLLDVAPIRIGAQTFIGPSVQLLTASHPIDAAERVAGPEMGYAIHIGSRVWLGGAVVVVPGVTIGDDTVIGAGSVVTRDVPARVVAAGNPCRVIRTL